jgi:hypothetical protein
MLTLATLVIVGATICAGFDLGFRSHRPTAQVLHALWPAVALLALWQLARFCSNTNEWGGDITPQLEMYFLAILQIPLFGIAAGAGALARAVVNRVPSRARVWTIAGIGLVVIGVLVVAGFALGGGEQSYPHPLPTGPGDFHGTDYGPKIGLAAGAAPFPILWLGPTSLGEPLEEVELLDQLGEFEPSALVDYDEHGTLQISEGMAPSNGQNDNFMDGPSITVHGATFYFYQGFAGSSALGKIRGRDVQIDAPVSTRAQWTRLLRSLRWVCPPARPHCSGW